MADPLTPSDYRTLALAGAVQAGFLVHATANGRPVDGAARAGVLAGITTQRADALTEIFSDPSAFALGVATLTDALAGRAVTPEVARYTLHLIDLARRLQKLPRVAEQLGTLLDGLQEQPSAFAFAHIYEETIATVGKRVQVTGVPERLQQEAIAADVRALLLGGVRFAWLWLQLGGRRWQLVLQRRALLAAAAELQGKLDAG